MPLIEQIAVSALKGQAEEEEEEEEDDDDDDVLMKGTKRSTQAGKLPVPWKWTDCFVVVSLLLWLLLRPSFRLTLLLTVLSSRRIPGGRGTSITCFSPIDKHGSRIGLSVEPDGAWKDVEEEEEEDASFLVG